jgi:hypothetical protein
LQALRPQNHTRTLYHIARAKARDFDIKNQIERLNALLNPKNQRKKRVFYVIRKYLCVIRQKNYKQSLAKNKKDFFGFGVKIS